MRMLDLKIRRDVVHMKGQFTAIAALVLCGVAVFVMMRSMHGYLRDAQHDYYAEWGFGDVFARAVRAPETLGPKLAAIPGVERAWTRIVRDVLVDVPGLVEPATGRLVSIPDDGPPPLNRLVVRSGRLPEPGRRDEVAVSEAFARANGLGPGDSFTAILNGRRERLVIVGTALSPEFIYEVSGVGTVFPDNRRFGAMWMARGAMEGAFEMQGAFNDVVLALTPQAGEAAVRAEVERLLERYGGIGAWGRDEHLSHIFTTSEIEETQITASFFPAVFLIVTAFLLHTTLVRLVAMEREQIGLLKAFGIGSTTVAAHYVKLALVPVAAGALPGAALGAWLAARMAGMYAGFFQFPDADFVLDPGVVLMALGIAFVTGAAGAALAARTVVRLAPAVAMAPPAPPRFAHSPLERTRVWRALGTVDRNAVRNLLRRRWRTASTVAGIALALGVLTALLTMFDAIDVVAELQFEHAYRDDVAVYFDAPRPPPVLTELAHLPGVLEVEPVRIAPARLSANGRERRTSLVGLQPAGRLRRVVDVDFVDHPPPVDGMLLGRMLAGGLGVERGDTVHIEVTEGARPRAAVVVAGLVDEVIGGEAYFEAGTLARLLGEGPRASGAWLRVDPTRLDDLYTALKQRPGVASVLVKRVLVQGFRDTIQQSFMIALTSTLVIGAALVVAIVYNQARIALSERGRDLASLRVLGFTRGEVARMLLGEQAIPVVLALPLGLAVGWGLVLLLLLRFDTELFRLPMVAEPGTYLTATGIVLVSAAASAWLVRRRLDRIDLIAVLKTRE